MRLKGCLAIGSILLVARIAAIAAVQSSSQNPPDSPSTPAQTQPSAQPAQAVNQDSSQQPDYVLRAETPTITVGVVATDSRGNAVRDLKPQEFEVSDNGPQKLAQFASINKPADAVSAALPSGGSPSSHRAYTNIARSQAMPPTVLLMDALNTPQEAQLKVRANMVRLLKTLPENTPIAVVLLGKGMAVVQDFTSDPSVLRAALAKLLSPSGSPGAPSQEDPRTTSEKYLENEATGGQVDVVTKILGDFENEKVNETADVSLGMTIGSLEEISNYLRGYPGRKNLIWVSSLFPITLLPTQGLSTPTASQGILEATRFAEAMKVPANALAEAQVAVYPLYVGGVDKSQSSVNEGQSSTSQPSGPSLNMPSDGVDGSMSGGMGGGMSGGMGGTSNPDGAMLVSGNSYLALRQKRMQEIAEDTGGRTCTNTDDVSECIAAASRDSSSYYELAYSPQRIHWDGGSHRISVKTARRGVELSYPRGYYAFDDEALANREPPEKHLNEACSEELPASGVPITVQPVPRDKPGELSYTITVPSSALHLGQAPSPQGLKMALGICQFTPKGGGFLFTMQDLTRNVPDAAYQTLQKQGFRELLEVPTNPSTRRVRFAVVDERTGLTGAVDIPVRAEDIEQAVASPATAPPGVASEKPASTDSSLAQPAYSVGFNGSAGASSALDWTGEKLWYHGDIDIQKAAPVFFHDMFWGKFQCSDGVLTPRDPSNKEEPQMQFTFRNPGGHAAIVDLSGSQPQYSGDLPVDASAKDFFGRLWYLCHCTSPPASKAP